MDTLEVLKIKLDTLNSIEYTNVTEIGKCRSIVPYSNIIEAMIPYKNALKELGYIYSNGKKLQIKKSH